MYRRMAPGYRQNATKRPRGRYDFEGIQIGLGMFIVVPGRRPKKHFGPLVPRSDTKRRETHTHLKTRGDTKIKEKAHTSQTYTQTAQQTTGVGHVHTPAAPTRHSSESSAQETP